MFTATKRSFILLSLAVLPAMAFGQDDPFYNTVIKTGGDGIITSLVTTGPEGRIELTFTPTGEGKKVSVKATVFDENGTRLHSAASKDLDPALKEATVELPNFGDFPDLVETSGPKEGSFTVQKSTSMYGKKKLIIYYEGYKDRSGMYAYTFEKGTPLLAEAKTNSILKTNTTATQKTTGYNPTRQMIFGAEDKAFAPYTVSIISSDGNKATAYYLTNGDIVTLNIFDKKEKGESIRYYSGAEHHIQTISTFANKLPGSLTKQLFYANDEENSVQKIIEVLADPENKEMYNANVYEVSFDNTVTKRVYKDINPYKPFSEDKAPHTLGINYGHRFTQDIANKIKSANNRLRTIAKPAGLNLECEYKPYTHSDVVLGDYFNWGKVPNGKYIYLYVERKDGKKIFEILPYNQGSHFSLLRNAISHNKKLGWSPPLRIIKGGEMVTNKKGLVSVLNETIGFKEFRPDLFNESDAGFDMIDELIKTNPNFAKHFVAKPTYIEFDEKNQHLFTSSEDDAWLAKKHLFGAMIRNTKLSIMKVIREHDNCEQETKETLAEYAKIMIAGKNKLKKEYPLLATWADKNMSYLERISNAEVLSTEELKEVLTGMNCATTKSEFMTENNISSADEKTVNQNILKTVIGAKTLGQSEFDVLFKTDLIPFFAKSYNADKNSPDALRLLIIEKKIKDFAGYLNLPVSPNASGAEQYLRKQIEELGRIEPGEKFSSVKELRDAIKDIKVSELDCSTDEAKKLKEEYDADIDYKMVEVK